MKPGQGTHPVFPIVPPFSFFFESPTLNSQGHREQGSQVDRIQRGGICGTGYQGRVQRAGRANTHSLGCLENVHFREWVWGARGRLEVAVGPCDCNLSHFCDKMLEESNLRKGGFLALDLGCIPYDREGMAAGAQGSWSQHPQSGSWKRRMPRFSILLMFHSGTPTCRSKLGLAFPPQFTQSRKSLADMLRGLSPR